MLMQCPARRPDNQVLLVDDDTSVLQAVQDVLRAAGYRVTTSSTVNEARRLLDEVDFDLVLTDIYLDGGRLGYEVAESARGCEPPVPTILLTAHPSLSGAQEAIRSSVSDFVVKPVEPMALITVCRKAIERAEAERRNRSLQAQNRVLAGVLPRAIEAKDPTTSGHAERVVRYTDVLAKRCGVSEDERRDLRMASLLHDVGKIGISERILTKEGPLTFDEREEIKKHPQMGHEILEPLVDGDRIRRWVYQHHERWDGGGYPNGLSGEEVDLPGRILILAEVYDALAEKRSYKPAWELSRIVGLFRAEAGKHFDPELARLVADGLERMGSRFFSTEPGQLFPTG